MSPENKISRAELIRKISSEAPAALDILPLIGPGPYFPEAVNKIKQLISGSSPTDQDLDKSLAEGPSSLIKPEILKNLKTITSFKPPIAGKPLAWLLNPGAGIEFLKVIASEARTQADVRKAIIETTKWIAEVGGDDAKRDVLLNYNQSLEKELGQYLEPFCKEKGWPVPPQNALRRMMALLEINAEITALQKAGREVAKRGEELVKEKVKIKTETARKRMLAEELPAANEAAQGAHVEEERMVWEKLRTAFSRIGGGAVAVFNGAIGGATHALAEGVKNMPLMAIPLGIVDFYLINHALTLMKVSSVSSVLQGAGLICVATVLGTGIGAGLAARLAEGKKRTTNFPVQKP